MRFAWWGAEESGLIGSTYYVNNTPTTSSSGIELNLNFDMIGSPNFARFIYDGDGDAFGFDRASRFGSRRDVLRETSTPNAGSPASRRTSPVVPTIRRSSTTAFRPVDSSPAPKASRPPKQVALYGGIAGEQYDPCYHLACDTFDNISLEVLDQNSDAVAAARSPMRRISHRSRQPDRVHRRQRLADLPAIDGAMRFLEQSGYDLLFIDDDDLSSPDATA